MITYTGRLDKTHNTDPMCVLLSTCQLRHFDMTYDTFTQNTEFVFLGRTIPELSRERAQRILDILLGSLYVRNCEPKSYVYYY